MKLDIDDLDRILSMLREDGRLPFTKIGKRLRKSESTIRKRVQLLQDKEIYS
jgi:DNA-binding Lrp family transcriptional regulator